MHGKPLDRRKFVEYFDSRDCVAAFDAVSENKGFMDGSLDVEFVWDQFEQLPPTALGPLAGGPLSQGMSLGDWTMGSLTRNVCIGPGRPGMMPPVGGGGNYSMPGGYSAPPPPHHRQPPPPMYHTQQQQQPLPRGAPVPGDLNAMLV